MKQRFLFLLVLSTVIGLLTLLIRTSQTNSPGNKNNHELEERRDAATFRSNLTRRRPSVEAVEILEPTPMLNAITITNLEDWKRALPKLQQIQTWSDGEQTWVMDARTSQNYIPVYLEIEGNSLKFGTALISIDAPQKTGRISELHLHTRNMNIEELRSFGIQLQKMLNLDPQKFIEWCDSVGNTSLDAPLYSSGAGYSKDPTKIVGFRVLNSFNDEKPWFVAYMSIDK